MNQPRQEIVEFDEVAFNLFESLFEYDYTYLIDILKESDGVPRFISHGVTQTFLQIAVQNKYPENNMPILQDLEGNKFVISVHGNNVIVVDVKTGLEIEDEQIKYMYLIEYLGRLKDLYHKGFRPFQFPDFYVKNSIYSTDVDKQQEPDPLESYDENLINVVIADFRKRLSRINTIIGVINEPYFILSEDIISKVRSTLLKKNRGTLMQRFISLFRNEVAQEIQSALDLIEGLPYTISNGEESGRLLNGKFSHSPEKIKAIMDYIDTCSGSLAHQIARIRMERIAQIKLNED